MIRSIIFAILVCAQPSVALASTSGSCAGADPAIVSVTMTGVTTDVAVKHYHLSGRVTNLGRQKQASNVLQFVDIYEEGIKRDVRGIPPLRPGQSYTFGYEYPRALDAGDGTTQLTFKIDMRQPSSPSNQNCNLNDDRFMVRF